MRNLESSPVVHRVKEVCQLLFFLPFLLLSHLKDGLSHTELHNRVEWRAPSFRPEEQGEGVQGCKGIPEEQSLKLTQHTHPSSIWAEHTHRSIAKTMRTYLQYKIRCQDSD